jgi:hypothetical protein
LHDGGWLVRHASLGTFGFISNWKWLRRSLLSDNGIRRASLYDGC